MASLKRPDPKGTIRRRLIADGSRHHITLPKTNNFRKRDPSQPADLSLLPRDQAACIGADPNGQACLTEREQYDQVGVSEILDEEKLDSIEVGVKATLFDNRLNLNVAAYYGEWENQKGRSTFAINESCKTQADLDDNSIDCDFIGDFKKIAGTDQAFFNARNADVAGDAEIHGLEIEAFAKLSDSWTASATYGWAETEYTDYVFNFVAPIAGFSQMKGNTMPRYPEHMFSASTTYTGELNADWSWFVRGDYAFFGETFVDESNLAKCDSYDKVDARFGLERDDLRVELWVRNVFDSDEWAACARWTDFDRPSVFPSLTQFQGVAVTPLDPRQIGIKFVYNVGG